MWNIIDDNTTKLILKRLKNRVNKIAYIGDSTKIYIVGNDMELKKSTKTKDTLIDIMNKRFDHIDKQINDTNKQTNEKFNKRFDKLERQTNKRFDKLEKEIKKDISNLDTKLNNVIKLNNLKV